MANHAFSYEYDELVPDHWRTESHRAPESGAEPQNTRCKVRSRGGGESFSASRQTGGTDDMNVIRYSSINAPSPVIRSARYGGRTCKVCPDSHG